MLARSKCDLFEAEPVQIRFLFRNNFLTNFTMFMPTAKRVLLPLFRTSVRCAATEPAPVKVEKTVNNVTILGRVGADPQLRGSVEHPVVTFSLATHTNYKYENGDWAQRTDWHRIVVFKPNLRDTVMDYLKKGQRTMVQGKITYGEITDQQGNQRTSTSIIADDVIFFRESRESSASS